MAETSELIEFRRAFVWLLCGMLLPSVALVAFGVVAVANERAAVERRLAEDYDARVRALGLDLLPRLDKSAEAVAAGKPDPLVLTVQPLAGWGGGRDRPRPWSRASGSGRRWRDSRSPRSCRAIPPRRSRSATGRCTSPCSCCCISGSAWDSA